MPNLWELPGGKIKSSETSNEAIVREIEEELGCIVKPIKTRKSNHHRYSDFSIELIPVICQIIDGEPKALEHEEIKWVEPDNLLNYQWAEADIPIIESYIKSLNSDSTP